IIGRPLMVMPRSSTAWRTGSTGDPELLGPSPETSMTWRIPLNPLRSNNPEAKASAPDMEVRRIYEVSAAEIWAANEAADWPSSMRVQEATTCCEPAPAHSTYVTAILP